MWVFAGIAVIAAGGMWYVVYTGVLKEQQKNPLTAEDVARNKVRITQAVADAGVDYVQAAQGFWYLDKDGNLFQYNPDVYANQGLSDIQIAALARDIRGSSLYNAKNMRVLESVALSPEMQFHNALYAPGGVGNTYDLIANIEKKVVQKKATAQDVTQLAHAYEQIGKYAKRDEILVLACKDFDVACQPDASIVIRGTVRDMQGNPVAGAFVTAMSKPQEAPVQTDMQGRYTLLLDVSELEKVRIKASKRNYSDGVAHMQIATARRTQYDVEDIIVSSPITIVTLNTEEKTVTGTQNSVAADGTFILTTPQSTYRIPEHAIVRADGSVYSGIVEVYLYEFTKDTVPESLVAVDTFDQVLGYAGDLMKTFGMPYIQFFTPEGEELHVFSTNPMVLEYRIYHMQALYNAEDQIYPPLTDADMQLLEDVSVAGGYPIDREFLIQAGLLRFPAFWVFDQARGVWDNVGVDVVDKSGVIRSIFYTIKNN